MIRVPQPAHQWVPSGTNLVHQPSLTPANERVSYGWQATRRLPTVAAQQRRWADSLAPASHASHICIATRPDARSLCDLGIIPSTISAQRSRGLRLASEMDTMPEQKHCVYILRSVRDRNRYYTGVTSSPRDRLAAHNAGRSIHTAHGAPWEIDAVIEFADKRRALAFERYLKSGSGCAFAKRHLRSFNLRQRPREPVLAVVDRDRCRGVRVPTRRFEHELLRSPRLRGRYLRCRAVRDNARSKRVWNQKIFLRRAEFSCFRVRPRFFMMPKPVVVALLRAGRGRHGDDHRSFPHAAQLPRRRDDSSRGKVQNVRGDSSVVS